MQLKHRVRRLGRTLVLVTAAAASGAWGTLLQAAAFAPPAAAQGRDPVAAEALFEAGRQHYQAGDFVAARAKFAEAVRLDPTAGAFSNLAASEEKLGLTASAWQSWRAALDYVPGHEKVRRASITAKVSALEPVLARLVLRLPPRVPAGTEVRRDGVLLGTAAIGLPLPVDPGAHEVIVSAPDHEPRRFEFVIAASDRKTVDLDVGPPRGRPEVAREGPGLPGPLPAPALALHDRAPAADRGPSALGITLLVGGGVALAGAGYTGYLAHNARGDAEAGCQRQGEKRLCMSSARGALDRDRRYSLFTDIGLGAGAVLVGAGLLFLLGGSDGDTGSTATLTPRPGGGTLELGGRF